MARIFLLRHGETESNRDNIVSGILDSKLTYLGKTQAKKLAKLLEKENVNIIYSSPLKRALETAQEIAKKHKLKVIINNQLREINLGEFEGKSWDYVYKKIPNWREIRYKYRPKGGETQKELDIRASSFLEDIKRKYKTETIVILAHGSVNKAILGNLLNIDIKSRFSIIQSNACVNLIEMNDKGVRVYKINSTNHLI
ncbi:MAG: histidine phosphatase family protein [Nanoarchaeota archaeon]|nr:histidine phosphatase family protein [Nanoarchaeota archaeon]